MTVIDPPTFRPGPGPYNAWPAAPLFAVLRRECARHVDYELPYFGCDDLSIKQLAHILDVEYRTIHRLAQPDAIVSAEKVDRLCVKVGLHPAQVYGQSWWDAELQRIEDAEARYAANLARKAVAARKRRSDAGIRRDRRV